MLFTSTVTRANPTTGKTITQLTCGIILLIGIVGTFLSCTKTANYMAISPELEAKLNASGQYEAVSIQKKVEWANFFMCFSIVRNFSKLSCQPNPVRRAERESKETPARDLAKSLRVFNGIKAVSALYAMVGLSFLYCWYSIIGNVQNIEEKRLSYSFAMV